ncbi:hypothetical protein PoB_004555700 [Plakobranchus ocellatus]|uniref:Uncharacterized protein n=1 Tax=Plakobranchus ocellatus TaxID=259542 RepID=A0AAV4BJE6_9GAST|nr:hypothetical protein PoB_004555700 [Plakobranchus ocellatus]
MLRISWTAKKTIDTVLEEAQTTRLLISKIRKRQATFFGHVMRREEDREMDKKERKIHGVHSHSDVAMGESGST